MNEASELFAFLSNLTSLREVITRNIEEEKSLRYLDIKNGKIAGIKLFSALDEKGREIILSVDKPEFSPCPPLTEHIEGWFDDSYKDFHTEDIKPKNHRVFKTEEGEVSKFFLDSDMRAREFAEWKRARILWRRNEREKENRHALFDYLYRTYEKLKRDENYELFVGNGLFFSGLTAGVNYPLILRRATLRYNNGRMELIDAGEDTIFSEEIFKGLDIITDERLLRARKEIRRSRAHPAEENLGDRLLNALSKILHENCRYSSEGLYILPTDWFILYERPHIFIRKKRDASKAFMYNFAKYLESVQNLPLPLEDFFHPQRKEIGSLKNAVLPKHASPSQEKILSALASSALVTVDAPPGTGKTHSVMNFLTYFLAQGKKILVTGAKRKTLQDFAENLPENLKLLTLSYKKNEHLAVEKAIISLGEKIEKEDIHSLRERVEDLKNKREQKERGIAEFKKKLKAIEKSERKTDAFKFEGKNYSLSAMAKYLSENENLLHIIPGEVKAGKSLTLSEEELTMLYETNALFTPQTLKEMTEPLPKSEKLLAPFEFEELLKNRKRLMDKERGLLMELPDWSVDGEKLLYLGEVVAENIDKDAFEAAERAYTALDFGWLNTPWAREAVLAGRMGGETKEAYLELKRAAEEVNSAQNSATLLLLGNRVEIEDELAHDARIIGDLEKMEELLKEKGNIPLQYRIFNRRYKKITEGITVNSYPITSALDANIALTALILKRAKLRLEAIWNELMATQGEKTYEEISDDSNDADEEIALRIREIEYAVEWYDKKRGEFVGLLNEAGINTDKIIPANDPFTTPRQQLAGEIDWLLNVYPTFAALLRLIAVEKDELRKIMHSLKNALVNRSSALAKRMIIAIGAANAADYKREYELLLKYESLADSYQKRSDLLSRLAEVAPDFAADIACQKHGGAVTEKPKDILKAYTAKQFAAELEKCGNIDFTRETEEDYALNLKLLESSVLEKFFEKIEKNGAKGSILRLAKTLKKSVNDRRRNKLNDRERQMFAQNMPLWVMPIEDIFLTVEDFTDKFDIIFMDGASDLDSLALSLLGLSQKAVIFGDRRAPVKLNLPISEEVYDMAKEKGEFYKSLTDTSFYELVRAQTEPYHLREEFRSPRVLSNIISKIAYDKELKPMRLVDDEEFVPIVKHKVSGTLDPLRPVNFAEAEEIALLISACLRESEYSGKTFGVISPSDEQAEIIFEIAMRRITPEPLEKISFISGTVADFIGKERDIIFLSLLDDETSVKNIPEDYELAFAVSRAKEQLFVVHSKKSFKGNDPRRFLFETVVGQKEKRARAKTALGREIAENLVEFGFDARESFRLSSMTLEIAVFGNGRACIIPISDEEGERIDETFLSEQDFKIIYIRAGKFYRNKRETLESLVQALIDIDINAKERKVKSGKELVESVYKNAANLREEYRSRGI